MRRGFLLVWTLVTAGIAAVAGFISYQAGYSAGLATKIPEGAAAVAPYWYYGPHFGFGFFGLIPLVLFVVLLFLVFGALGRGRRGWGYRGYPGGPGPGQGRHPMEERLREWHERAHGEPEPPTGSSTGASTA